MITLWTALVLGFAGSLHCLGMCGPIAFTLGSRGVTPTARLTDGLIYNAGRLLTYFFLGTVMGMIGYGFSVSGYQQWLSIALGVLIISGLFIHNFKVSHWVNQHIGRVKKAMGKAIHHPNPMARFSLGVLNGFLPCGLVYVALTASIATTGVISGGFYMVLFGLGTLPAMLTMGMVSKLVSVPFRAKLQRAIPYFIIFMGAMLIVRGLGLGIPYVSPAIYVYDGVQVTLCQ
jgi:uncharacterized protein